MRSEVSKIESEAATADASPQGYDAMAIANWFVRRAEAEGYTLSIMKLLKLLYFAHGFYSLRGSRLIRDDFQAWQRGPVVPKVYHYFRDQGILVKETLEGDEWSDDEKRLEESSRDKKLLEGVYDKYSKRDPFSLSRETHGSDSPWLRATKRDGHYAAIEDRDIADYFKKYHLLEPLLK